MGRHVTPALTVLKMPPAAAPTYMVEGSPGTPTNALTRPALFAGPSGLQVSAEIRVASGAGDAACGCASRRTGRGSANASRHSPNAAARAIGAGRGRRRGRAGRVTNG